jgi:Spy/CpxP family protein refolding chaperone
MADQAHNKSMKRWLMPTLIAVTVLALGVLAAVNSSGGSDDTRDAASQSRKHDDKADKADKGNKRDLLRREWAEENEGHGPPAWAHSNGPKHDKSAREEWRKLTPEQRRDFMEKLIREHTEAMKEWGECVAADRDDCVMPMPPGLAKQR